MLMKITSTFQMLTVPDVSVEPGHVDGLVLGSIE